MDVGGAFAAISAAVSLVDEDNKIATVPVEGSEDNEGDQAMFSDEDAENPAKTSKNDENTDDDDDLPLSKVSI